MLFQNCLLKTQSVTSLIILIGLDGLDGLDWLDWLDSLISVNWQTVATAQERKPPLHSNYFISQIVRITFSGHSDPSSVQSLKCNYL